MLGPGYQFQPFPDVIKCEAKTERWLPFEKDNNGPKMFCLPHGHKEHKPVHKIKGTDVHFQVLWAGKDGKRAHISLHEPAHVRLAVY